jgi:hypothetical protein
VEISSRRGKNVMGIIIPAQKTAAFKSRQNQNTCFSLLSMRSLKSGNFPLHQT